MIREIGRRESAIQSLTTCRRILERRTARLTEDRDRLSQRNRDLLSQLKSDQKRFGRLEKEVMVFYREQAMKEISTVLSEAMDFEGENRRLAREIEDLREELEARKVEVIMVAISDKRKHSEHLLL